MKLFSVSHGSKNCVTKSGSKSESLDGLVRCIAGKAMKQCTTKTTVGSVNTTMSDFLEV